MRGILHILALPRAFIMELSCQHTFAVAAITDEFSPDIEIAVRSMTGFGMTGRRTPHGVREEHHRS